MNQPNTQTIVIQHEGQSALGTAGLIFSCIGWLTCGMLCIPGAFFSFLGLFSAKQKGHAIAGLIVGFPGVLVFMFAGAAFLLPMLGLGALIGGGAIEQARQAAQKMNEERQRQMSAPQLDPESAPATQDLYAALPDPGMPPVPDPIVTPDPADVVPMPAPAAEPVARFRTFTNATGKFKVEAELVAVKNGWVKLRKEDGKELTIQIAKLSDADQEWINANAK